MKKGKKYSKSEKVQIAVALAKILLPTFQAGHFFN